MTEVEFLQWVRGPAFQVATAIFVVGIIIRLVEVFALGRARDLAEPRGNATLAGLKVIVTRSIPKPNTMTTRSAFTETAAWIFHTGLLLVILFAAPHIPVFEHILGFSWPNLPTPIIEALSVITIITLIAVLLHRIYDPVMRFLSRGQDYLSWLVTFLPMLTGYLAFHQALLPYKTMLALHILSVELLMVVFPFSKLMHAFTVFSSRYFNGAAAGFKGVSS